MHTRKATAVALAMAALIPTTAHAARPVALADARTAPTYLRLVPPGETVTKVRQCSRDGWFSDVSAYRWTGAPLPAQRWSRDRTVMRWGGVTYDGVTFTNATRAAVLVAGWCER